MTLIIYLLTNYPFMYLHLVLIFTCLIHKYNHSPKLLVFSDPHDVRYRKANGLYHYSFGQVSKNMKMVGA